MALDETEAKAMRAELEKVRARFYDGGGNSLGGNAQELAQQCLLVAAKYRDVASLVAAHAVYMNYGLPLQGPITVADIRKRSFLAALFRAKPITIGSVGKLALLFKMALIPGTQESLQRGISTLVFMTVFSGLVRDMPREAAAALGHIVTCSAYGHAKDVLKMADEFGL